ncbi:MAG: DUF4476 domain-containing protein [Bacteroidota bacterium]
MRTTLMTGGLLKQGFNPTKFIGSISLLMIMMLFTSTLVARNSILELNVPHNMDVVVEFNNRTYDTDCQLTLRGLREGTHNLRVYTSSVAFGCGNGYNNNRILYSGPIDLEYRSRTVATIHPRQGLCIDAIEPLGRTIQNPVVYTDPLNSPNPFPDYHGNKNHGNGNGYGNNNYGNDHGVDYNNGFHNGNQCGNQMNMLSNRDLNELLRMMDQRSFDRDRLRLAKRVVNQYNLKSHQVHDIMLKLCFDSSRLDFAKYAFDRTMDPHRYHVVYNAFDFRSSERELDRYIRA